MEPALFQKARTNFFLPRAKEKRHFPPVGAAEETRPDAKAAVRRDPLRFMLAGMEWFADEDFWSVFYEWMFPSHSFAEAIREVEALVRLLGIDSGSVLDLCCGPGRHSVALAKRGFEVTGVDLQPALIAKARE